jgi:glycosyltransferase involved in cell wall biosynthesis
MKALVVHPSFGLLGGGEYLCLNVVQALAEEGYEVSLMSSDYDELMPQLGFGSNAGKYLSEVFPLPRLYPLGAIRKGFGLPIGMKRTVELQLKRRQLRTVGSSFHVAFHTQTSLLVVKHPHIFNFLYEPMDLRTLDRTTLNASSGLRGFYHNLLNLAINNEMDVKRALNIPLSASLERFLQQKKYRHTGVVSPPCELTFKPRKKIKRVIQVTRIAPQKRLEYFFEVASLLPEIEFVIVGYSSQDERKLNPGYTEKIESISAPNVRLIFDRIKNIPEMLEESSVYLYTSKEPGINISTVQGIAAGCVPVTPSEGGGSEIVSTLGRGYTYSTPAEAAAAIRDSLANERWSPSELSKAAQIFSPERFRGRVRLILKDDASQ